MQPAVYIWEADKSSVSPYLKMEQFQKQVVYADPLNQAEQIFWQYLTRKVFESDCTTNEFHIHTVEAYPLSYGHLPDSLSAAARAVSDLLESLRAKGIWVNLNDSDMARLKYISESTMFPSRPEIVACTVSDPLYRHIRFTH